MLWKKTFKASGICRLIAMASGFLEFRFGFGYQNHQPE